MRNFRKSKLALFGCGLLASQAACAASAVSAECTISGMEHLSGNASAEQLCHKFEQRLRGALQFSGKSIQLNTLRIDVSITKLGSMSVRVSRQGADTALEYPVVTMDVMDRPLSVDDVDRLANAVAQVMSAQ